MERWHVIYQNPATASPRGRALDVSLAKQAKLLFAGLRREIKDSRVISAMERVPRELFVPPEFLSSAYRDEALSIGHGQTISQPTIVAMMTSALGLSGDEKVLEVGTGSGYQAAILSFLAREVVTVERQADLIEPARARLRQLGRTNVRVYHAGEAIGWPEEAPYDAAIVTAAAPSVPGSLVRQLRDHGRIVIPLGGRLDQQLVKATVTPSGLTYEYKGGCRFVPLIGPEAFEEK